MKRITRTIRDELPPSAFNDKGELRPWTFDEMLRCCAVAVIVMWALAIVGAFSLGWWAAH